MLIVNPDTCGRGLSRLIIKHLPGHVPLFQNFQIQKRMRKKPKADSHFVYFDVHIYYKNY